MTPAILGGEMTRAAFATGAGSAVIIHHSGPPGSALVPLSASMGAGAGPEAPAQSAAADAILRAAGAVTVGEA